MKTLRAGQLRFCIRLFRPVTIRDDKNGAPVKSFDLVTAAWADVEPISNRKIRTGEQGQVVETLLFTLRPCGDVQTDWRIELKGRVFTARAVDSTQPDRLLITAEADTRHDRV